MLNTFIPKIAIVGAATIGFVCGWLAFAPPKPSKLCPKCGEAIRPTAKWCRYCRAWVGSD